MYKIRKYKLGGGVGIFVSDRIQYTKMSYDCIEHVVINITTKNQNKSLTLGSLYRAPNTKDQKFVEEYECLLQVGNG